MATSQTAPLNRSALAGMICARLQAEEARLTREFRTPGRIQSCLIDNLLPEGIAHDIYQAFPKPQQMMLRKSIREHKYVAAQMNRYNPLLEEAIFAFQDSRVGEITQRITGISDLIADSKLYAGGISLMAKDNFLNPHLDNSHDKDRENYRVLNLLYYVSPNWTAKLGGNLELWDSGPKGEPREIVNSFNRLVFMATHEKSWHSVNQVKFDRSRCCVSNYYFSKKPLESHEYFHVTSFAGRPEQPIRNLVLRADAMARQAVRRFAKTGVVETKHVYNKP